MKTVYFKFANPPPGVSLWEVAFTQNPGSSDIANWSFTGFQTLDKTIKATMPDDANWVAFYAGIAGQQASYGVANQESVIFGNNATYIWDVNTETLTREDTGGTPAPVPEGSFMDTLNKYAVPLGIGVVLLGLMLTRKRD